MKNTWYLFENKYMESGFLKFGPVDLHHFKTFGSFIFVNLHLFYSCN